MLRSSAILRTIKDECNFAGLLLKMRYLDVRIVHSLRMDSTFNA